VAMHATISGEEVAWQGLAAGEAEQVYVSFNNNNRDYPVRNALMMKKLLGQPVPGGHALPGDLFA